MTILTTTTDTDLVKALRLAINSCNLQEDVWHGEDGVPVLTLGGAVNQMRLAGLGPESHTREDLLNAATGTRWRYVYRYRGFVRER